MFTLTMPAVFHVGDTAPCSINGEDTTVTYTDCHTPTLGTGATHQISHIDCSLDSQTFVCGDGVVILVVPNEGGDIPL